MCMILSILEEPYFTSIAIMKTYLWALLLFLCCCTACKKDKLTKETQNGANTLSCLLNGVVLKPCSHTVIGGPNAKPVWVSLSVYSGVTQATIGASCNEDSNWAISLEIGNLTGTGEYLLSSSSNRAVYTVYEDARMYSSYNTGIGKIIITKDDRANTILSGTFEFEGKDNDDPGKIMKITSGRFDINYKR